jgi:putative peptidoglycan lipid II flippase
VLREPLVAALFQRGEFTETSTYWVATALALYALGLPAHSAVEILVRAFYALHDTKTPVAIGVAAMGLNVVLSLVLVMAFQAAGWLPFGGLALSNSLATTAEMAVLLALLRRRMDGLEGRRLLASLARIALAAAAMGAVVAAAAWWLQDASAWLLAGVALLVGAGSYAGVSLALGAGEPRAMWQIVRARRHPPDSESTHS